MSRIENDFLGSLEIPDDVYYGVQTMRGKQNFHITEMPMSQEPFFAIAFAYVKKAAALTNKELGTIPADVADALVWACDQLIAGKYNDQFVTDWLQGGAGTSTNMNCNEVICNLACEHLGLAKGDKKVSPNDHANFGQSTNDTYPTALHLSLILRSNVLVKAVEDLVASFYKQAEKTKDVLKMGRTHLQDAVPMSFAQEFHGWGTTIGDEIKTIREAQEHLKVVNLGATAIGTGICADLRFRTTATRHLAAITGLPITASSYPVAAMTDMSGYIATSQTVKNLAIHLKKAADDLRLLNSGPHTGFDDLNVPARQAGSSIMPGKVNPVIPECVNQCCFMVFGMDTTVTWAASEGQLQLNAFDPVIIHELLNGIELLTRAMAMFRERCVSGITINASTGRRYAEYSPSIAAALNGAIGYEHAADIAQEAANDNRTVRDVAGERTDLPASTLDELLDPIALSRRLGQTCREHQ